MDKIYLIETSFGSFEDYHTKIIKAFYTKEKAVQFKEEYNTNLRELKHIEEIKENRDEDDVDYEILYETYDAEIKEVSIE